MKNTHKFEKCFQCGKPSVVVGEQKEYFKGSLIVVTQRICSDPECQANTQKLLKREKDRRDQAMAQKTNFGTKKFISKKAVN